MLTLPINVLKYIRLISTQLKWASDHLLHQSFYSSRLDLPGIMMEEPEIRRHGYSGHEAGGNAECSICLCKIEEGHEVRELRCDHLFHRLCLDRWLAQGRITCPLCRNYLAQQLPPFAADTIMQVVLFRFGNVESSERDQWWIR